MPRKPKKFQAFTSLMDRLLKVSNRTRPTTSRVTEACS